jgi:predicted dithiol-disulfide oxidoreductase (DUF899 family)
MSCCAEGNGGAPAGTAPARPLATDRAEWLAARKALLEREKALTRARDAVTRERQALPLLTIDEEYTFVAPGGRRLSLPDLFEGRRQLITYHLMGSLEGYGWCPVCSFWVDNIGHLAHLHARDTTLVVVSPEPPAETEAFVRRMGWTVPVVSCHGTTFYEDFHVRLDPDDPEPEMPGVSTFLRDGDVVRYAYSTYRRGSDLLNTTYNYLDLTPLGRQEDHLEDKMDWVRHHDAYEDVVTPS